MRLFGELMLSIPTDRLPDRSSYIYAGLVGRVDVSDGAVCRWLVGSLGVVVGLSLTGKREDVGAWGIVDVYARGRGREMADLWYVIVVALL
jgi:hypothetical protein